MMDKQQTRGYFLLSILILVVALFLTSLLKGKEGETRTRVVPETKPPVTTKQPKQEQPPQPSGERVWEGLM